MASSERITLTAAEIAEARGWLSDCEWRDLDADDIAELTDAEVVRGVARHYDGGLEAFIVASGLRGPTLEELHADDVRRGAVHVNTERWEGRYCVLVPDAQVVGRWLTIASFKSVREAEAFAAGYCARRDGRTI